MKKTFPLLIMALVASPFSVHASNCNQAQNFEQLAEKASNNADDAGAEKWLLKAVEACSEYKSWFALGMAQKNLAKIPDALNAFMQAAQLASNNEDKSESIARYGEVLSLNGQRPEALSQLQLAREIHPNPPEWMNAMAMELDKSLAERPSSADDIKRGLATETFGLFMPSKAMANGTTKSAQPVNVLPSVNIRLNFKYDSTDLEADTASNLQALSSALGDSKFSNHTIKLVGHSDATGDAGYNMKLSLSRAQAVRDQLVQQNPALQNLLTVEGAGESKPLYKGDSDEIYRLNRRLQVVVQ